MLPGSPLDFRLFTLEQKLMIGYSFLHVSVGLNALGSYDCVASIVG